METSIEYDLDFNETLDKRQAEIQAMILNGCMS